MRVHGSRSCYVLGCRLPECVEANRIYQREYRNSASARTLNRLHRERLDKARADAAREQAAFAAE